jgi:hypothetical protein
VILHVADVSGLTTEEQRDSYSVNGQVYGHLTWHPAQAQPDVTTGGGETGGRP